MTSYGTPFLETEALLAILTDGEDAAREKLRQMSRTELEVLRERIDTLDSVIAEVLAVPGRHWSWVPGRHWSCVDILCGDPDPHTHL